MGDWSSSRSAKVMRISKHETSRMKGKTSGRITEKYRSKIFVGGQKEKGKEGKKENRKKGKVEKDDHETAWVL